MNQITIENHKFQFSEIKETIIDKIQSNSIKLLFIAGSLLNIFFGFYFVPYIFSNDFEICMLNMILSAGFYFIYGAILIRRVTKDEKQFTKLTKEDRQTCQYITYDAKIENRHMNIKNLFLNDIYYSNKTINSIGIFLILQFTVYQLYQNCYKQEDDKYCVIKVYIIYFGEIASTSVYIFSKLIQLLKTLSKLLHSLFEKKSFVKMGQKQPKTDLIVVNIEQDCSICLSSLQDQQQITTYFCCKNSFHANCIEQWVKESKSCPLCRQKIH